MTADSRPSIESRYPGKRRLRNFLLDPRFQLKYTGMVIAVTLAVAAVLGFFAYRYSTGQTEMMAILQMESAANVSPDAAAYLQRESAAADRRVLMAILAGVALLVGAVGLTGIWVTHKLVGPAYRMKRLLRAVEHGQLKIDGRLRKGDELQDLYSSFERMVESLRARQLSEIEAIDRVILQAREAGTCEDTLRALERVRDHMHLMLS